MMTQSDLSLKDDETSAETRRERLADRFSQFAGDLWGSGQAGKLPTRTRRAIGAKEDASEILIRLIQLLIVCMIGLLYLAAPKNSASMAFTPVPYVIVAYLVLTLNGLLWSLRSSLPDWSIYGSILIDFALLYGLIISFHIQYDQPAAFVLKAPTLLYVFVFIALRTLRFEPRFVVAAGAVAVSGWIGVVIYATMIDPDHSMITRDYVHYLTSNSVLIGAEIEKIVAIVMVTGILAISLQRANSFLVSAVSEQGAARQLSRFFDPDIAKEIRDSDNGVEAGGGVNRDVAILYVDIRGFTPFAATRDPADVVNILSEYERTLIPIIRKHGGTIDKFLGDGIMATFGAVAPTQTYAADALRAADAISETTKVMVRDNPLLTHFESRDIGMGIASGTVVFGAIGEEDRLEFTVIGSAVNLAAKMEKFNKDLQTQCLVDGATLTTAEEQGYVAGREITVKSSEVPGVREKMDVAILHP